MSMLTTEPSKSRNCVSCLYVSVGKNIAVSGLSWVLINVWPSECFVKTKILCEVKAD